MADGQDGLWQEIECTAPILTGENAAVSVSQPSAMFLHFSEIEVYGREECANTYTEYDKDCSTADG